jgi:hypothetical protein
VAVFVVSTVIVAGLVLIYKGWRPEVLSFQTQIEVEPFKYLEKYDYKEVSFWVHVFNKGKETLKNAHLMLRIKDPWGIGSLVKEPSNPSLDKCLPIPLWVAGKEYESYDIAPGGEQHYVSFRIPFRVQLATTKKQAQIPLPTMFFRWDDPIKQQPELMAYFLVTGKKLLLRVEVFVIPSPSEKPAQRFMIEVPVPKLVLDPAKISFRIWTKQDRIWDKRDT